MTKTLSKESRSWPVTIVAGLLCVGALAFAALIFKPNLYEGLFCVGLVLFALLAGIIAFQGKRKTLRELISAAFWLP